MKKRHDPAPDVERRDYTEYPADEKPEKKAKPLSALLAFLREFGLLLLGVLAGSLLGGLCKYLLGLR